VSPVKYELGFYIPEDDILHSHSRVLYCFLLTCLLHGCVSECHNINGTYFSGLDMSIQ
jgi:hypothetical protein